MMTKLWLMIDNFFARLGILLPGARNRYMMNPLKKYPRNLACFCGSGHKFKGCCYHRLPKTVPIEQGLQFHRYLAYVEAQTK